ncbi:MAG: hypothetical protein QXH99_02435 [Sulfolobales archaeon]|jgi:hypothetical protein
MRNKLMVKEGLEDKVLEIIKSSGEEGVVQSELWGQLNIDSREGSKIVMKLVKSGLVSRVPVVYKGRKTYKLVYVSKQPNSTQLVVKLNPVMTIPCFLCKDLDKCGLGSYFNPLICNKLTTYLLERSKH